MRLLRSIFDERTTVALCGLVLTAIGFAMVFLPLALIVPGTAIFALAVWPITAPKPEIRGHRTADTSTDRDG